MATCAKCSDAVKAISDSIKCRNTTCKAVFHARCVGIQRNFLTLITENSNLFFYCDSCSDAPPNMHTTHTIDTSGKTLSEQSSLADNISEQLVSIQESLSKLTDAITKPPEWPSVIESSKALKRRRVEDAADIDSATVNTPRRKAPKLHSEVVGSAEENDGLQVVEPRKLLVASLFHPSTDSDKLSIFIKGKLNITDESTVRVHKLVPAGKDLATLDYVSFKVDVPGSLFKELLSPLMWPKGVRVREFEHRPRKPRSGAVFLPSAITAASNEPTLTM